MVERHRSREKNYRLRKWSSRFFGYNRASYRGEDENKIRIPRGEAIETGKWSERPRREYVETIINLCPKCFINEST